MKKLVLLNIALTVALAVYVFIFVPPPISRATLTPTLTDTPLWVGPTRIPADTDTPGAPTGWTPPPTRTPAPTWTPGPSPTCAPTSTPALDEPVLMPTPPTNCPCGVCKDRGPGWYCCRCPTQTPTPTLTGDCCVVIFAGPGRDGSGIKSTVVCPCPTPTSEIWQPPPTYTPTPLYSPTPTPTPSCDLTVYLRGTNNPEGFAAFSGEHVDAGWIYTEGAYVYGEVAARIGSREWHCYRRGDPFGTWFMMEDYWMEFKFSDSLLAATRGVEPRFHRDLGRFWAGILDCNSATPKPYRIEATLYKDEKIRKHTEISFFVVDDPLCDQP